MNGVVFHTSVAMITNSEVSTLREPGAVRAEPFVDEPGSGVNANCQASAATTVMIPYGTRIVVRTSPRPTSARCITRASAMPITNSIATEITVISTVVSRSVHHLFDVKTET